MKKPTIILTPKARPTIILTPDRTPKPRTMDLSKVATKNKKNNRA